MREFNKIDPQYKTWRASVLKRDGHKCQFPCCEKKTKVQIHHIRRWVDFPLLRYEVSNGITLCKHHHWFITGKETHYQAVFQGIVNAKNK